MCNITAVLFDETTIIKNIEETLSVNQETKNDPRYQKLVQQTTREVKRWATDKKYPTNGKHANFRKAMIYPHNLDSRLSTAISGFLQQKDEGLPNETAMISESSPEPTEYSKDTLPVSLNANQNPILKPIQPNTIPLPAVAAAASHSPDSPASFPELSSISPPLSVSSDSDEQSSSSSPSRMPGQRELHFLANNPIVSKKRSHTSEETVEVASASPKKKIRRPLEERIYDITGAQGQQIQANDQILVVASNDSLKRHYFAKVIAVNGDLLTIAYDKFPEEPLVTVSIEDKSLFLVPTNTQEPLKKILAPYLRYWVLNANNEPVEAYSLDRALS